LNLGGGAKKKKEAGSDVRTYRCSKRGNGVGKHRGGPM